MRQLRLEDAHAARGARFGEAAGARVVLSYGDPAAEAARARREPVLFDRSVRGRLAVRGADRVAFLHGQSTNDVKSLVAGRGQATAFLTGKGKMRGDGLLLCRADELWILAEGDVLPVVRRHLEGYIVIEDVSLHDLGDQTIELGVHGPGAGAALDRLLGSDPAGWPEPLDFVERPFAGDLLTVIAERPTGEEGYEIVAPAGLAPALFEALAGGLAVGGAEAFEILRVEAGVPRFGADTDEDTIPIEAGLDHAVSYSKGCYTGNEVLARIRTYGHVNRHLVGLLLEGQGAAVPGGAVRAGDKVVGKVTSSVVSAALGRPVALAMLRREAATDGTAVEVEDGQSRRGARVARLPLIGRRA